MSKKEKIHITPNENLASIDEELDAALGALQQANEKVSDLLTSIEGDRAGGDPAATEVEPAPAAEESGASDDGSAKSPDGS